MDPRILFVTRKWRPAMGGMEIYCERLVEQLERHEPVDCVALPGREDGRPPPATSLLSFPLTVLRRWIARSHAPQVLHLGDMAIWPFGLLARLSAGDCTVVLSAHGTDVSYPARGGLRGTLYGWYQRIGARALGRARVIANSATTARAAEALGWNVAKIVPLATDMEPARDATGIARRILFAGRLVERKGCGWFVREVLDRLPSDIVLDIAGTGWHARETQVFEHRRVNFLGRLDRPSLAQAYARSLCTIVPNLDLETGEFEGFGLVACEASAAGGVVLAAATGGLIEAVRDEETGFLLPPGNAQAWLDCILKVAAWTESERAGFTTRASAAARSFYRWERVAGETVELYPGDVGKGRSATPEIGNP